MRKLLLVLTLLAFTLPTAAHAIEDKTAPADTPFVLINTYSQYGSNVATNQGYSLFANAARSAGYRIEHQRLVNITDEALEDVDILVLAVPYTLLDDDKAALRRFVRSGGGLFVLGGPGDASGVDLSSLDSLIREYGLWFGISEWSGNRRMSVLTSSPLSGPRSCNTIVSSEGRGYFQLNTSACEVAAISNNGYNYTVISNHNNLGSGRLVAVGDTMMFANTSIGKEDNEAFGVNILDYLSGGCDLRVTLCKAKLKGGKVKIIAKVRNVGTSDSESTIVRFYLSSSNIYPVGPAGVAATLGSVDLPALKPGKSKKVKVKLNIPGWVTPGDYYVIAVADPDGDTSDNNTDNNYKASKKKITIN